MSFTVIARLKDGNQRRDGTDGMNAFLEKLGAIVSVRQTMCPTNRPLRSVDHTLQLRTLQDVIVGMPAARSGFCRPPWDSCCSSSARISRTLVMARAGSRRREFVLRTALGASRGRLLRQSITEGAGDVRSRGILGLWLASAGSGR